MLSTCQGDFNLVLARNKDLVAPSVVFSELIQGLCLMHASFSLICWIALVRRAFRGSKVLLTSENLNILDIYGVWEKKPRGKLVR
jgi:hypothetical protein